MGGWLPSVSLTMLNFHHDLTNSRRVIDACMWGLTSVVRYATPQIFQGEITIASEMLLSLPAPARLC